MVLSCIILNRLTDLHVLGNGSVISMSYRDHFLVPYVRFFRYAVNTYLILVDYNMHTDRAHLDDEFLKRENICLTDCPARYPDINSCFGHCGVNNRNSLSTSQIRPEPENSVPRGVGLNATWTHKLRDLQYELML